MLSVKGIFRDGRVELLEPIPNFVSQADLHIIILPKDARLTADGEHEFSALGLSNFFGNADDQGVDWEVYFGLA